MEAGELYNANDPELHRLTENARLICGEFNEHYAENSMAAQTIVGELLGGFGADSHIRAPLCVDYGINIFVGERTFINFNLTALDVARIEIGNDCQIGPNVQLLTPTHPLDPQLRLQKLEAGEPIVLEDNVWLGGGVIVCPGVRIGENSVIGAGAVVLHDVPPNSVAVGNPARVIKRTDGTVPEELD